MNQSAESSGIAGKVTTSSASLGWALVVLAVVGLGLLFVHPDAPVRTFADFVRDEAASQTIDAVVHGGFVLVLLGFFMAFAAVAWRPVGFASIVALVLTGAAFMLMSQSLIIDGLVTPSVAHYYVGKADLDGARPAFIIFREMTAILLPFGLVLWAASGLAWTWAAMHRRLASPIWSWVSYALAATSLILAGLIITESQPFFVMFALLCQLLWTMNLGFYLVRRSPAATRQNNAIRLTA